MGAKNYRDLIVWQKAMDLVLQVYALTSMLPKDEQFALCSQMKRAAVSIPSNIAEGQQRNSNKEFVNFLAFARGSNAELETQLEICVRLQYFDREFISNAMALCSEIGKMLNALMNKLSS